MRILWGIVLLIRFAAVAVEPVSGVVPEALRLIQAQDDRPSMIFLEGEPLRFRLTEPMEKFTVHVTDYRGRELCSVSGSGSVFALPPQDCGYYRIRLDGGQGERGFCVLSRRTDSRETKHAPSRFGADLALYNGYEFRGDPMGGVRLLADICGQLGVGRVRNRLVWELIEKDSGGKVFRGTGEVARILHAAGIESNLTFHDAPERTKSSPGKTFPDDLSGVYEFCRSLAAAMPEISVWEFWNEQDMHNGREFAAALKAAYLGFKAGNPAAAVTPGSFFVYPFTADVELMFRNGAGDYCDIINCHIYLPLPEYPAVFERIGELRRRFRLQDKPLWITENGIYGDGDAEVEPGILSEAPEQSSRQELLWAEFVPKGHILCRAGGADRSFTFNLRRIQEGKRQWGLLRPDFSVKPAAVTLAVLNRELGDAEYAGELAAPEGIRAFLFTQPDGLQTLAVWMEATLDRSPEKFFPKEKVGEILRGSLVLENGSLARSSGDSAPGEARAAAVTGCDAFGGEIPVFDDGGRLSFEVGNLVSYLRGLSGLRPQKGPGSAAASFSSASTPEEAPQLDRTVILQAEPGREPGRMTLSVWNLSPESKTGTVDCSTRVSGLGQQLELPPMGKRVLELQLERDGEAREAIFSGRFNGRPCSKLVVPYAELRLFRPEAAPVFLQREAWEENSSGVMEISFDSEEKAMVFHTVFQPGSDRWSYPVFEPRRAKGALDLAGAFGIAFEMKEEKPVGEVQRSSTYLCWIDGTRYPIEPSFGKWTECVVFFPEHPEKIEKISFGLNPRYDDLTFRLRNFRLLR